MTTNDGLIEQECILALAKTRPEIAIKVTREVDDFASWDEARRGPRPDNLTPYIFTVEALAIRDGVLYRGEATMSESWCAPDEDVSDIHGFLPQMVDEAVEILGQEMAR